jgi:hypothetical protein
MAEGTRIELAVPLTRHGRFSDDSTVPLREPFRQSIKSGLCVNIARNPVIGGVIPLTKTATIRWYSDSNFYISPRLKKVK